MDCEVQGLQAKNVPENGVEEMKLGSPVIPRAAVHEAGAAVAAGSGSWASSVRGCSFSLLPCQIGTQGWCPS